MDSVKYRKTRMTLAAFCGIACLFLAVFWVRSYRFVETFGLSERKGLRSERGEVMLTYVEPDSLFSISPGYSRDDLAQEDDPWDFRRAAKRNRTWNAIVAHGEAVTDLHFLVVEYYALVAVLLMAAFAAAPWIRQFSLRTLLIAMTFIAVVFGIGVLS